LLVEISAGEVFHFSSSFLLLSLLFSPLSLSLSLSLSFSPPLSSLVADGFCRSKNTRKKLQVEEERKIVDISERQLGCFFFFKAWLGSGKEQVAGLLLKC